MSMSVKSDPKFRVFDFIVNHLLGIGSSAFYCFFDCFHELMGNTMLLFILLICNGDSMRSEYVIKWAQ